MKLAQKIINKDRRILSFLFFMLLIYNIYVRMVRGYDPVSSDLPTLMWNYLFSFWTNENRISLAYSEKCVRYWLKNSKETSALYNSFAKSSIKPSIKLKKHCQSSQLQAEPAQLKQDSRHFPAATVNNSIIICVDHIENKLHLKQNLDRQLTYLSLQNRREDKLTPQQEEQTLMKNLFESCYAGYANYRLSNAVTKQMAVVCSKYLFFRKSKSTLPVDRKFRYSTQLADELLI